MDNADIRNYRRGGTRRKVALALMSVAVASMVMATEASAKPGKKGKQAKSQKATTEQTVEFTVLGVGIEAVTPVGESGNPVDGSGEESWVGESTGVRWR